LQELTTEQASSYFPVRRRRVGLAIETGKRGSAVTLAEYLKENSISANQAGKDSGLAASTVWRLARGDRYPGLEVAQKIERWSAGKVPLDSWERRK
jgi:hypothetical protein